MEGEDDLDDLGWKRLKRHFCKAADKVVDDAFYNARISAVCKFYKKVKHQDMSKKLGASKIYLTEEEYLQTSIDWIAKDMRAWRWLARRWSSPDWIASSRSHRANRGSEAGQRFGADGHFGLARRMVTRDSIIYQLYSLHFLTQH